MLRHPCQDEPLILSGLIVTADPQVDRRANAIGVHSSPSELYRNDSTDPGFVELFVRDGRCCVAARHRVDSAVATAGLIPDPTHGSVFAMEARGRAFAPVLQHLKSDGVEMQRHVRKKSL